jgi:hypothetical protein
MKTALPLTMARYIGIGVAICLPTLVVAQTLPTFGANQVLRAEQLQILSDAIAEARRAIDELQGSGVLIKNNTNIYEQEADSGPIPTNSNALAQASCRDPNDVLLNCSCEGRFNGVNQLSFELRRVRSSNPANSASVCTCQGTNVGSEGRSLFAIAQCVVVP